MGCSTCSDISGIVGPQGPQGSAGAAGAAGSSGFNSYSSTTANFIMPAVGATVTVPVSSSSWMSVGLAVYIAGAGYFVITAVPTSTSVTLSNLGYTGNITPGAIGALALVTASGTVGASGINSYTSITSSFVVPAASSTVNITVANTSWMAIGEVVYISNAGYYTVNSITSPTVFVGTNLGYLSNAAAATVVPVGSAVVSSGPVASGGYIKVSEVQAQNTASGTFTQGSWVTRVINTEDFDTANLCSIASNQITLLAGTYEVRITSPAYLTNSHQARLQNITSGLTLLVGTSAYSSSAAGGSQTESLVKGRITLAVTSILEVQHQCQATSTTHGLGVRANFTSEVFAVAEFTKVVQ